MMKLFRNRYKKTSPARPGKWTGQGMVEFALALPILLLVVYGLLESGRLLFIYSSTVTAARQAARYGSATGNNDGGTPYYRDCAGIRDAAQNVGFLNAFEDNDISITYDRGLDNGGSVVAIPGVSADPATDTCSAMNDSTLELGDRIKVQVSTVWTPIIAIVPSWQGFTITSAAERTILTEVAIGITPSGGTWGGPSGSLSLSVTSPTTSFDEVGDVISYTYTLTNTSGSLSVSGPFTVSDNKATSDCSAAAGSLAPSATTTCTGTYTVTQADLDAGSVVNLAGASGTGATSNQIGLTIPAIQTPEISMVSISPDPEVAPLAGTLITYTYLFQNTGNVTLTGPYTISDNKVASGDISCAGAADPLAPGATAECEGTYVITVVDIANGAAVNTASVTANFNGAGVAPSNSENATVVTSALQLTIVPPPSITTTGPVQYKYNLTNTTASVTLDNPQVSDNRVAAVSCPGASILPGDTIQCTGSYMITQPMLDAGTPISNQATATADGGVTSNLATASASFTQTPAVSLAASTSTSLATVAGTSITYSYVITNEGNVTLNAPFVIANPGLVGTPTCTVASGSIAPLGSLPCSISYPVDPSDLAAGSIRNTATTTVNGTTYMANLTTVITHNAPRLTTTASSSITSFSSSGTPILFSFTLRNTGNSVLNAPYSVTVSSPTGVMVNCPVLPATLGLGESVLCTAVANYLTTPIDTSNGKVTLTAEGKANGGALTSASVSLDVPYSFQCFVYHRVSGVPDPSVAVTGNPQRQITMTVFNDAATAGTITITKVELIDWDQAGNYIDRITFGGSEIYPGNSNEQDPLPITVTAGDRTLAPGASKVLIFYANKNLLSSPIPQIKVTFAPSGCPVLDTNLLTQIKP